MFLVVVFSSERFKIPLIFFELQIITQAENGYDRQQTMQWSYVAPGSGGPQTGGSI